MSYEIPWDKIEEKPEKQHKVIGQLLLDLREKLTMQENMIANVNEALKNINDEKKKLVEEVTARNGKILELVSKKIPAMNKEIEDLKSQIQLYAVEREKFEAKTQGLKKEIDDLSTRIETAENELKEKDQKIAEQKQIMDKYENRIKMLEAELEEAQKSGDGGEEKQMEEMRFSIQEEFEKELKTLRENVLSAEELEEIEKLRKLPSAEEIEEMLMERDDEIERLSKLLEEKEKQVNGLNQTIDTLEKALKDLSSGAPSPAKSEVMTPSAGPVRHGRRVSKKVAKEVPVPESTPANIHPGSKTVAVKPVEKAPRRSVYVPREFTSKFEHAAPVRHVHQAPPPKQVSEEPPEHEHSVAPPTQQEPSFTVFSESSTTPSRSKKAGKLSPQILQIFDNLVKAVQAGIKARELGRILADSRDEIANIYGFSSTLNEIGRVARNLNKAPVNAGIDGETQKVFLQKIEEWKNRLKR
ncbi:MAG: hypothetical protein ACTSSI_11275 [Candidatus Helarchaeota archaeon]